jgi:hypothetical protein
MAAGGPQERWEAPKDASGQASITVAPALTLCCGLVLICNVAAVSGKTRLLPESQSAARCISSRMYKARATHNSC